MRRWIRPEETLLGLYALLLAAIVSHYRVWHFTSTLHLKFLDCILVLALLVWLRTYLRGEPPSMLQASRATGTVIRDFFPFYLALLFYEVLHDLTPVMRPEVMDAQLIAVDRAIFGVDVAYYLGRFGTPLVTQVMIFAYLSYFFAPALLACLLYFFGRRQLFRDFLVTLSIVTFLGYCGYLLVPAVGPYVYQASLFPSRLPGAMRFNYFIASIDNIKGMGRDCFPSMHTAHTTVVLVFARRYSRALFLAYLPLAICLYVSTVYLRMHYVVDVMAGFAFAAVAIYIGPRLERWWFGNSTEEISETAAA